MADGLKVTISGIGSGLTVDKNGRKLLPVPFIFQCSPLEEFAIAHTFNMGTYDTIDNDQFLRRGSRQLDTWSFDTLAMYLGVVPQTHHVSHHKGPRKPVRHAPNRTHAPSWVPYPTREPQGLQFRRPEWYRDQLVALHNAGAPFRFVASFQDSTTIRRVYAVLTAFNEVYKHGEGDSIYFQSVTFSEWRDPRGGSPSRGTHRLPAHVKFRQVGSEYIAYDSVSNRNIPHAHPASTLADLARFYYGDPGKWRQIAHANHLTGGSSTSFIFHHWYPHRLSRGKPNVTMLIPAKKT